MITVSFYTKDTIYEQEAMKLMASLQALNMDYDVQGIESRGNWRANVGYKPTFLLRMLEKHKQPIMWMDVDDTLVKCPEILLQAKCDIAFVFVYEYFGLQAPGPSTAILYFANNGVAKGILKDWIALERKLDYNSAGIQKTGVDMSTFRQVISKNSYWALRASRLILPMSYLRCNFLPGFEGIDVVIDHGHIGGKNKKWKKKWERKMAKFQSKESRPEWETNPQKYIDLLKVEPLATVSWPHLLKAIGDNHCQTILECGFGGADDAIKIHEEFPNVSYMGIDKTEVFVDRAKELCVFPNFEFLLANMEAMPFSDNSFDLVYGKYVLEHLPYYKNALKEMIRVARKKVIVVLFRSLLSGKEDEIKPDTITGTKVYENSYARIPLEQFVTSLGHKYVFTIYETPSIGKSVFPVVTVMDISKEKKENVQK